MKAVLALSGDPLTNGHISVIRKASAIFKPLVVAIGVNPDKKYTFSLDERESLAKQVLTDLDVEVTSFSGLLIDFAKLNNIKIIIRSIRNAADYNYEQILNDVNYSQQNEIETIFFFAKQNLTHISSSAVKDLQKHHGDISEYVPVSIKDALERRISKQTLIGITGGIGSGKSYFTTQLLKSCAAKNIESHNIDLDEIGRNILTKFTDPYSISIRDSLFAAFGTQILDKSSTIPTGINLRELTNIMFTHEKNLKTFNTIMKDPTIFQFRQMLNGLTGIIFVNSALFAEGNLAHLTNYNVICVTADDNIRKTRLIKRNYSQEKITQVFNAQMTQPEKLEYLTQQTIKYNYGCILQFENSNASITDIDEYVNTIVKTYNIK